MTDQVGREELAEREVYRQKARFEQAKLEGEEEIRYGYQALNQKKQNLKSLTERKSRLESEREERLNKISIKEAQVEQGTTALELKTQCLNALKAKQFEFAEEALRHPQDRDAFEYGHRCGMMAGYEASINVLLQLLDEEKFGDKNI